MPSHLTRNLFRGIILNDGLVLRCPTQTALLRRHRYVQPSRHSRVLRRTIFGFSEEAPRKPKAPELAPGYPKMLELNTRMKTKTRLPAPGPLLAAFREFLNYKKRVLEPINNLQIEHALRTFNYLLEHSGNEEHRLSAEDLTLALGVCQLATEQLSDVHKQLAEAIVEEMGRRGLKFDPNNHFWLRHFVAILTKTGATAKARKVLEDNAGTNNDVHMQRTITFSWALVLKAHSRGGDEKEFLQSLKGAYAAGQPPRKIQQYATLFYASRNDVQAFKTWFSKTVLAPLEQPGVVPGSKRQKISGPTLQIVLSFCLRHNEVEWCNSIFEDVLAHSEPDKFQWDVILQWAAGALGKGVEDVERMMHVMTRRLRPNRGMPNVVTLNGLIKLAASFNDPYLAERYIALGVKLGIRPDADTYMLQLDYRIVAGDMTGAQVAYEALQAEEVENNDDLRVINRYIRALCSAKTDMYDRINSILADLNERDLRLQASTVASLCSMYLSRGEFAEVVDILQINTYHHDLQERTLVRNALVEFCMNRANGIMEVWQTYGLIRDIFLETDIDTRTRLMNEFFARGRSDMACYVFGHMRAHDSPELRPICETYVQCFEGIARNADQESLDMVHNMMKLDSSVEPTTRLYNSLMMAYAECGDAYRALDFWVAITNSREGPSYNSLEIVFRACSKRPFGEKIAREIWSKMNRLEVEITPKVFAAYCSALAGQGKCDETKALIEGMEQEVGFGPDYMTLGIFYNSTRGDSRKDSIEAWAKDLYPEQWAELEKIGRSENDEGWQCFNIVVDTSA
ncbi:pentatricopeptide repeat domain-containing protein [Phlyctema vagabunda]|uniref:Pentatricopeptide repeat domain-containing protein n=1 Tax=Phlyctema vagabunda TaxID=108571 RepID=A0ABR4PLM5_9HELO